MNKTILAILIAGTFCQGVLADEPSTYDVQFEANGMTYTLYDQSFPLELSVDDSGYGSFRDVFDNLYMVAALDQFTQFSESLYQNGDEASIASNPDGGFTLTISRPFTGTIDLTGEYEYEEPILEYDPELDTYVEIFYTSFGHYGVTISVPGYGAEPELTAIVASSGDVGKVIGANGRLYQCASAAALAGTTAEAMVAWLDMTNRTGLAIALADASDMVKIRIAETVVSDWEPTHRVALAEWRLPTLSDWRRIFAGCGGEDPDTTLTEGSAYDIGSIADMLQTAGGVGFSPQNAYASSTTESTKSWCFNFDGGFFTKRMIQSNAAVRACLAFDFMTPYDTWAATNGLAAAEAVTEGVPNLIRYAFGCPSGACNPFAGISLNASGKPVVRVRAPANTEGVSISLLSSTNLTDWSQADELAYTDFGPNGELIFEHDTADPMRFYRLKVEE